MVFFFIFLISFWLFCCSLLITHKCQNSNLI
nr:MAG TPA: hypothetical protein [Caudoviricetes sp.]